MLQFLGIQSDTVRTMFARFVVTISVGLLTSTSWAIPGPGYDYNEPAPLSVVERVETYYFPHAQKALQSHEYDVAWGELAYILNYFPNHPQGLTLLQELAKATDRITDAKTYFEQGLSLFPTDHTLNQQFAEFLASLGEWESALAYYRNALASSPEDPRLHYDLGWALLELGRLPEALEHAQYAYEHGSHNAALREALTQHGVWPSTS